MSEGAKGLWRTKRSHGPAASSVAAGELIVCATHHVDASERDADGFYEYFYEYDVWSFSNGGPEALFARGYVETPREAHFLKMDVGDARRRLVRADFDGALAKEAIAWLRRHGRSDLTWLSGAGDGYEPVPAEGGAA